MGGGWMRGREGGRAGREGKGRDGPGFVPGEGRGGGLGIRRLRWLEVLDPGFSRERARTEGCSPTG